MCAQAAAEHGQSGLRGAVSVRPVLRDGALKGEIVAALVGILVVSNNVENAISLGASQMVLANARLLALHNLDGPHLLS
jgi:hypothetical protein